MTGFVTNETQFIVLRFLLGLGEAGFIREFYYWLPSISRIKSGLGDWYFCPRRAAGADTRFVVIRCTAGITRLDGASGWFWMFVIEGLPAVVIGIFAFSGWMTARESPLPDSGRKKALTEQLASENAKTETTSVLSALKNIKVWHRRLSTAPSRSRSTG